MRRPTSHYHIAFTVQAHVTHLLSLQQIFEPSWGGGIHRRRYLPPQ